MVADRPRETPLLPLFLLQYTPGSVVLFTFQHKHTVIAFPFMVRNFQELSMNVLPYRSAGLGTIFATFP